MTAQAYPAPDKPLTLAAYDASPIGATRAYIQPVAVGDLMPEMPLFLSPGAHIALPLQETYDRAFAAMPKRWRKVIEARILIHASVAAVWWHPFRLQPARQ